MSCIRRRSVRALPCKYL